MLRYDSVTGQPMPDDSGNLELISEEQAIQNANLVNPAYDYDPATRFANMQYQQPYMGYQQPYYNPYQQQPQYYQTQQQYYQQPSGFGMCQGQGFQGYTGSPYYQQQQGFYNPYFNQPQDQIYYIPGFCPGGETMIDPEFDNKVFELQLEMEAELESSYNERVKKTNEFYQRSGYNYYGMAPVTYNDPAIINKYRAKVQEMIDEGVKNRQKLNHHLSKLVHNYEGEEITDEEIEKIYSPKEVVVKAAVMQDMREQEYLAQFQPYNNAYMYQQAFAQVAQEQAKYFPENCDLAQFFECLGAVKYDYMMEEERQRRKNGANLYNQDGSYRSLIKQKIMERKNSENGVIGGNNTATQTSTPPVQQPIDQMSMSFGSPVNIPGMPTLSNSGTLFEDGTLQITPPPGLGIGSNPVIIHNEEESGYEASRKAFIESIYMDNPVPGGGVG